MLTAKQEAFAQSIADGLSQSDAYRANYAAGKMADKTVWEKASALAADGKVAARIAELREALAAKQLWTREQSVAVLRDKVINASESPKAALVAAVKELNAMYGFNEPAKVDMTHKGIGRIVLEAADDDGQG